MPRILNSLIQSDFGGDHGNFEAVIQEDDRLIHYRRDSSDPELPWHRLKVIVPGGVAGAGSIYQSDFGRPDHHGNFEVVVPLWAADQRSEELWHFWHNNSDMSLEWQPVKRIATNVDGPGCIIQSDFGNFEVVVPLWAADGTQELWHFWHNNSDMSLEWQPVKRIATNVAGPGCIIQSDFGRPDHHGNF